jgi:tryptophan synthase alpha subunit
LEITLPASGTFSPTANQQIIQANRRAVQSNPDTNIIHWLKTAKPCCVMFYREAVEKYGFETLLERLSDYCSGILLEWDELDVRSYYDACRRFDVELLQVIRPGMGNAELKYFEQFIAPNGFVYLECAPQAGGLPYLVEDITQCVRQLKERRPDTVVVATLGIKKPEDVRRMGAIPGINAVVVGTGFFEAAVNGVAGVQNYLETIAPALLWSD